MFSQERNIWTKQRARYTKDRASLIAISVISSANACNSCDRKDKGRLRFEEDFRPVGYLWRLRLGRESLKQ